MTKKIAYTNVHSRKNAVNSSEPDLSWSRLDGHRFSPAGATVGDAREQRAQLRQQRQAVVAQRGSGSLTSTRSKKASTAGFKAGEQVQRRA
jgi:hypothetical protein